MFLNRSHIDHRRPQSLKRGRRLMQNLSKQQQLIHIVLLATLLIIETQVPNAQAMQQSAQPTFVRDMNLLTVKENTPIGEIVYTLEAQVERVHPIARLVYSIEGTQLFSVDKNSGQVKVAQLIDREQTSDSVTFQVSATTLLNLNQPGQAPKLQPGPSTQLSITVIIIDENDNAPKIERVKVGSQKYDSFALARLMFGGQKSQQPLVHINVSESRPVGSVIVDVIEAIDVDKASSNPLSSICLDCEPEFELRSSTDDLLNDRLNSSIVLMNPLVHVPRNNVKQLHVVVSDGKFNTTILFELTIEDIQNRPPQFVGSTTCVVQENVAIDKTVMNIQAIDGDAIGPNEALSTSSMLRKGQQVGRHILYDMLDQEGQSRALNEVFKLHPLTGQLQVANRLDREAYLNLNDVLSLRIRARELTVNPATIVQQDESYQSILDKLDASVDPSLDATSEVDITVILVDVNDNEPHWLNSSEINELNMNKSPNWYTSLPNNRDTGRIYQLEIKENSSPGAPITTRNEMFVFDLDNGANANFNISIVDPFNLFDVEPKQVSGFALVTLKLANNNNNKLRQQPAKLLDYENLNERRFFIQLIATETNTNERHSSKAQVTVAVLDVNDNAPEFKESKYLANIREDAPPGKTVLLVQATDRDEVSRQLFYTLHGRAAYLFDINRYSGLITVASCELSNSRLGLQRQCIDYEQQKSHHLMVEVSDGELSSKVPLTIFIDDASDNAPVFTLPVVDAVIEEGADRLDPPIKIEATDVDQTSVISYSIVEGNFEGLFTINNATGEVQLTRPIRIPHEDLPSSSDYRQQQLNKMTLIIEATDGVASSNGTIRIDVLDANDNAPKFIRAQYSAEISESSSAGQPIVTVRAIDSDRGNNARVSYKLQRGSYGQFEIDEATGAITVARQARNFDASKRENYTLEVVAYDHGLVSKSSSILVHVHVLDTIKQAPEFEPQIQRVIISETTLNNTIIYRMRVADQDQQLGGAMLIFEPGPIEALDKNGQAVVSNENDRLESMFSVSANTGDVMVNSALDHDFAAVVNLTVYVSSRQFSPLNGSNINEPIEEYNPRSVGYLMINVVDDNSNSPIIAAPWTPQQPELWFKMQEELPVGSILTQLVASDTDSKISHFKIDPPNEYFELSSPQSGIIVNKKLIDYDTLMSQTFLTPGSYRSFSSLQNLTSLSSNVGNNIIQFNVYVFDSGLPQLSAKATISVEILPVNDWDCKFEQSVYEVHVKENTLPDTLLLQVRAIDLDFGEQHNSIRYQLIGEHSDFFTIDSRTGLITVSNKGSVSLDRESPGLGQSTFAITVIGRDEQQSNLNSGKQSLMRATQYQSQQQPTSRSCLATIKVHVDDVNDNPPLFSQKLYEVTAYDTDIIDVPIAKLSVRDNDLYTSSNKSQAPINSFKIISGNVRESFNISSGGLIYVTKALNESLPISNGPIQLRVQVKQQSPTSSSGIQTSFSDECLVRVNFVKFNRHGPEWRFDSSLSVKENAKPGTLVTQLKCIDKDLESKSSNRLVEFDDQAQANPRAVVSSPIRYWIRENGSNVLENNEFRLDSVSGNLFTRIELDRESQASHQLVVVCEDNGKPQSLESVSSLFILVMDIDDNKPEFVVPKGQNNMPLIKSNNKVKKPLSVSFTVEEHQSKGLPVGELKAIDRDLEGPNPINYCLIDGNEFQEFSLDRISGILYTNQTLDREKQSSYDLLIKAINDGSNCADHMIVDQVTHNSSRSHSVTKTKRAIDSIEASKQLPANSLSYLSVKIEVLDINDNAPVFKRPINRAGVHHRSLMNTLITQVAAYDPDSGLNGTLNYKITEVLMYKTSPNQQQHQQRKHDPLTEQLSKPIKLIQFPFKIDQQGNLYSQQLLTQYQLMSMFVLSIEASEQADPWRSARTKLEVYVYETSSQLKIRINLHPRLVELYRSDIETLLSNATRYTAIINRARRYHETLDAAFEPKSSKSAQHNDVQPVEVSLEQQQQQQQPSFTNIHLIFVDNFRIVNPNVVMEKFDLTSAQLFMPPSMLTQTAPDGSNQEGRQQQQLEVNEVSSLIDKIALASVQSAEYHASASALMGADWLENPSVIFVSLAILLTLIGFIIFLFGCCCTSRIKDHIVKVAMNKLVKQQNLQAKINEQVLAATNQQVGPNGASLNTRTSSNAQEFILRQGGFMSSFDATKSCVNNNTDNMNILQRAMDWDEFIDPNYTTLNGHVNMGAHYYDDSELETQQVANEQLEVGTSKQQMNGSSISLSMEPENEEDFHEDLNNNNNNKDLMKRPKLEGSANNQHYNQRQRQQIPRG